MLCVTYSSLTFAQQPELCKSTLTIGAYELGDCGLLDSKIRSTDTPTEDEISEKIREHIGAERIGTGFIYGYNGKRYVITCEHVIFKAGKIYGYDADFKKYELELVGGDTFYDLAVLKFKNPSEGKQFESVQFETQLPDAKERVQSMGFWDLNNTRLSFSGEVLDSQITIPKTELPIAKLGFVEHTAKLPKGFSGGILIDNDNQVLGMNVLRRNDTDYFYALQSRIVKSLVEDIIDNGKVQRAFTGIQFAQDAGSGGVIINEIISNSPAAEYRKELENRIVKKINNKAVYEIYDVLQIMENIRPDTPVTIELDNSKYTIQSVPMKGEQLRQIAEHAIHYHEDIRKIDEAIIIDNNGTEKVAKIAGKKDDLVYCLNSPEQLGIIVRIFGLHRQLRISTNRTNIGRAYKEITFSNDGKLGVLYY